MSHYYETDPNLDTTEFEIHFNLHDQDYTLLSSAGVFSKEGLDTGSRILIETVLDHASPAKNLLDLGCGTGVIGVVLAHNWHCPVTGIDPNGQACHLADENYTRYHIDHTVLETDHIPQDLPSFDTIVLNPPIRTGKKVIYALFEQAANHLSPDGSLWIVIRKQHGAQSALENLESLGLTCERVCRDKGFWVICATRKTQEAK